MRFTTDESNVYKALKAAIQNGATETVQLIHQAIVDGLGLKGKKAEKAALAERIFEVVGAVNAEKHKEGRQAADHFGDMLSSKTSIIIDEETVAIKVGSLRAVVVWHQTQYQARHGGRTEARRVAAAEKIEKARDLLTADDISVKKQLADLGRIIRVDAAVTIGGFVQNRLNKLSKKLDK